MKTPTLTIEQETAYLNDRIRCLTEITQLPLNAYSHALKGVNTGLADKYFGGSEDAMIEFDTQTRYEGILRENLEGRQLQWMELTYEEKLIVAKYWHEGGVVLSHRHEKVQEQINEQVPFAVRVWQHVTRKGTTMTALAIQVENPMASMLEIILPDDTTLKFLKTSESEITD